MKAAAAFSFRGAQQQPTNTVAAKNNAHYIINQGSLCHLREQ